MEQNIEKRKTHTLPKTAWGFHIGAAAAILLIVLIVHFMYALYPVAVFLMIIAPIAPIVGIVCGIIALCVHKEMCKLDIGLSIAAIAAPFVALGIFLILNATNVIVITFM